jgi:hypothetical protein
VAVERVDPFAVQEPESYDHDLGLVLPQHYLKSSVPHENGSGHVEIGSAFKQRRQPVQRQVLLLGNTYSDHVLSALKMPDPVSAC